MPDNGNGHAPEFVTPDEMMRAAQARLRSCHLHLMVPMYGGMAMINFIESLIKLQEACRYHNITLSHTFIYNESLINRARNRAVDRWIKTTPATHGLFVDADIGFNWEDILICLGFDLDVVALPCSKKSIRWERVQAAITRNMFMKAQSNGQAPDLTRDDFVKASGDHVINWLHEGVREIDLSKPQEVRTIGTGVMMIRRNVVEKLMEVHADRWYEGQLRGDSESLPGMIYDLFPAGVNPETHNYESEDYAFCNDARSAGFKIWVAPWARTSHLGSYVYVGDLPAVSALCGELGNV